MDHFRYEDGRLFGEGVDLTSLARAVGTPCYVYSKATLLGHYQAVRDAFAEIEPLICYSIKSCGNLQIVRQLGMRGAGMDVVSGGELHRAQQAGVPADRVVYAGVGKTDPEIRQALEAGIAYFNIESEAEFENIARLARAMGKTARGALRVNPDVDPKAHAKTSTGRKETKFGVDLDRARRFFDRYGRDEHLRLTAIHLHIGSPIYDSTPYVDAITKAMRLIDDLRLRGFRIDAIDIGGGFGADYHTGQTPSYDQFAGAITPLLRTFHRSGGQVILEPGRTISANAGVLLTTVQYLKTGGAKRFVIVDTGMHHLLRPTLYDSFHFVWPTAVDPSLAPTARVEKPDLPGLVTCDVVGPICETGDYLALGRAIPPVDRGDVLAVFSAGAYGMVMASRYNAMPLPAEVLVDGTTAKVIRQRETYDDLIEHELEPQPVAWPDPAVT